MKFFLTVLTRDLRALVIFCLSLGLVGVFVAVESVEAASSKVTICHRTRSVTNPYRRITVSRNAVVRNAGHGDHTGGVFNTTANYYNTNPKNWGDIIPSNDTDGNPYNGENSFDQNWDASGKAIFLPTGVNASKCGRMTAKQFYDIQVAAGVPSADVITELNDMDANEDEALLAALSGGVFSASNLSTWAAAVAVTTNAASAIVDGTGSDGTATLNGSLKYANLEAVKWYFELATDSAFTSLVQPAETKTYATVNSLTADGTAQSVSVNVTALSTGNYYFRVVGISDYNTDLEGVLYGETKTFSIGLPYVTTDSLPDATVGSAYTETLTAAGGIGEKTNFRLNTGSLPLNLAITNPGTANSTATVNGTPASGTQGLYTLPIKVDDSKSGTANTSAVKDVTLRIKAPQTVTVPTPASKTYGDPTFNINATTDVTADEIGDLGTFTSYTGTSGVCSVSSTGVVTILAAGSCTVTANHSGNGYWLSGSGNVTFTIATKAITLTAANKSKVVNGTDPTPSVTVTSGSLVGSDAVSGATYDWSGNSHSPTSSIPNFAGTFTITPSAATFSPGSASNYNINYATGTLTVTASAAAQTIDFPDPADKTWGDSNFSIDATSKDGGSNTDLQVAFTSLTTGVCTVGTASKTAGVSSVTVTIVAVGTCTVETTQAGGSNGSQTYSAASSVQQSITVSPKPITIKADDKSKTVDGSDPTFSYTLTGSLVGSDAISGATYTHSSSSYTASTTVPNVVGSFTITPSAAVFSSGSASNYTITYQTGTLTVSAAPTTSSSSTTSSTVAASSSSMVAMTAPTTTVAPKTDPRKTTTDPFANVSVEPKQNKAKTGGTLTLDGDPPMEALSATSSDPNVQVEITTSGVEYNKPQTWVDQGFGDERWKFEPGGSAYILPAVPAPPSGRQGAYSLAKVKAGSITSTDPNFQVNTLFVNPQPGDRVWPDSNKNGIYDAGGKNGDKDISHVILCVRYLVSGTTSSVTYAPQATSTTTTPGGATTSTTVASGTSTSSTSTTVGSSTSSSPSTTSTVTSAPSSSSSSSTSSSPATSSSSSTSVPASSGSTTSTLPKDAPDDDGDNDNIVLKITTIDPEAPVDSTVEVTIRLSTGFEDKTIRLAVMPKTFVVKKVESLSTDEAVKVFTAEVKTAKKNAKARPTKVLPATGSESSGTTVLALWLVLAGVAVRVAGYGLGRRRRIRR